ncbi:MAG TPA: hypothetical protein VJ103_01785 [Candidatus Paceibacterota bacterium]|nr:hypothetical protein [Candidatus Paceibacterota bacterium]
MKWLENLRSKPKAVRRHIAHVTAIVLGGIIFLFWAVTLPYRLGDVKQRDMAESLKPLSVLKDAFKETLEESKTSINQFEYDQ